jgi:hypothetical protein
MDMTHSPLAWVWPADWVVVAVYLEPGFFVRIKKTIYIHCSHHQGFILNNSRDD